MTEQLLAVDALCASTRHLTLNVQKAPQPLTLSILLKPNPHQEKEQRIVRFTLPVFLERARAIHGTKYNYDAIKETDIRTKHSVVTIVCTDCGYEFEITVTSHIHGKHGCKSCNNNLRWTYERLIQKGFEVHGNRFDYSRVTPAHIVNGLARIPLICNDCGYEWNPTIHGHINHKHNCPSCANKVPWTYDRLLTKAREIHGDKYNYNKITPGDIKGVYSKIALICNVCGYEWDTTIHLHINGKCDCPSCMGNAPWTYDQFIKRANEVHGDKFDYSKVAREDITGSGAYITLICNDCGYEWEQTISGHVTGYDCPSCMNMAPWTYDRFIKAALMIHGDKYDYNNVTNDHIRGVNSRIPVRCNRCTTIWWPTISGHVRGYGCSHCNISCGYSKAQVVWLEDIMKKENIIIRYALSTGGEYFIPTVGKVDGFCPQTNTVYEFHGDFWHGNPNKFPHDNVNPVSGKTYGELYARTSQRDQKIRDLGYNLIVKWETEHPK